MKATVHIAIFQVYVFQPISHCKKTSNSESVRTGFLNSKVLRFAQYAYLATNQLNVLQEYRMCVQPF